MYSQVDSEGFRYNLLDSIIDHQTDGNAVQKGEEYAVTKRGQSRLRRTTTGWKLLILWKDGTQQWAPMEDIKASHPVEVAEYAQSRSLTDEPAFKWWVPYTLKKRDRIIASVNSRVKKATHKYGIEVLTSVEHALKLDKINGNTMLKDAIKKKMYNVSIAFKILDKGESAPPWWDKYGGHIIFDIKINFTCKAQGVKDGQKTYRGSSSDTTANKLNFYYLIG